MLRIGRSTAGAMVFTGKEKKRNLGFPAINLKLSKPPMENVNSSTHNMKTVQKVKGRAFSVIKLIPLTTIIISHTNVKIFETCAVNKSQFAQSQNL